MTDDEFAGYCRTAVAGTDNPLGGPVAGARYVSGGYDDPATYARLAEVRGVRPAAGDGRQQGLLLLDTTAPVRADRSQPRCGGTDVPDGDAFVRAVIEKPFGWDESSADLYADLSTAFVEEQIFRIDHYLAKETVQNLLALRFANSIFEPIWNRTWVDNVQITVAETLGVGQRGGFYETTGAMRDIVQNHVLQVLSLFLMEPPTSFHPEAIRDEKVKLLRAIQPLDDEADIAGHAVRVGSTRGGTRGDLMPGYREEPGVDPLSSTETFVAMRLNIQNWRWTGVPVYVRTGKRLPTRVTEVAMQFRHPPQLPLFPGTDAHLEPDALIVRVQPNEGLSLRFGAKVPGHASVRPRWTSRASSSSPSTPTSGSSSMRSSATPRCSSAPTRSAVRGGSSTRFSGTGAPTTGRSRSTRRRPGTAEASALISRDGRSWREFACRPLAGLDRPQASCRHRSGRARARRNRGMCRAATWPA